MTSISYSQFTYDYHREVFFNPDNARALLAQHPDHTQRLFRDFDLRDGPLKIAFKEASGKLNLPSLQQKRINAVFYHSVTLLKKYALYFKEEQLEHTPKILLYANPTDLNEEFISEVAQRLSKLKVPVLEKVSYPNYAPLCVHPNRHIRRLFGEILMMEKTSDTLPTIQFTAKLINQYDNTEQKICILEALLRTEERSRIYVSFYALQRRELSSRFNLLLQMIEQLEMIHRYTEPGVDCAHLSLSYLDFIQESSDSRRECLYTHGRMILLYLAKGASPELLKLIPEVYDRNKMRLIEMIARKLIVDDISYPKLLESLESLGEDASMVLDVMTHNGTVYTLRYDILTKWFHQIPSSDRRYYKGFVRWMINRFPLNDPHDPRLEELLRAAVRFKAAEFQMIGERLIKEVTDDKDVVTVMADLAALSLSDTKS